MKKFSAVYLLLCLAVTISVMFVNQKWATSVPEIAGFALAVIWVIAILLGRVTPQSSIVLAGLGGVLLVGGVQLIAGTTVYRWPTQIAMLYWAGNTAIFFCGLQIFGDKKILSGFLRAVVVFGFVVAIFCAVQALTSSDQVYWHFSPQQSIGPVFGPFLYRNQFAAFVELLLPVAIFLAITARTRKALYYVISATLYASVIASASRGGFVLATIELAVVPVLALRRRSFSTAQIINGLLALVGMLLWLAIPAGPDALMNKFGKGDAFAGRREFNESSLEMIKARPLMGFGLGNWPTAYPGYAKFDDGNFANQAHNDWAQWTVEGGIPLLLIMLAIAGWATIHGFRTVWGLGVPIIFVHCFADYPIQRPGVSVLFFLMMAAIAHAGRRKPEEAGS